MSPQYSVLYVDDEPGLLEIAKIFLEQSGEFRVDTLTSAQEALDSAAIRSYDAIVADYQMPVMDGITFLRAIRERFGNIPFIIFTGRGREQVVIEAINNGVDFYLQKGGDPQAQFAELAHKIRHAVERKRSELSLIDSEKRLADIINFLPDATFAIDRTGTVIAWNRAIEEMTGIPAAGMLGKGDFEYAIPFYGTRRKILIDLIFEPDEVIAERYGRIFHDKDILIAETSLPRPQGRVVTLMGKASPLYNRQGEMVGAIESIRDITDRKRAEEDLLRAKKDWETIFRAIGHPAFVLDLHNNIIDANDATLAATGKTLEELKGKHCFEIFHKPGTTCPPGPCPCEKLKKTGLRETVEMEVEGLNGFYLITCTPVFDTEGKLEKVIHIAMDVTERRKIQDELRATYEQLAASDEELRGQYEELARSGQQIRESEEKFRELADLLPQVVFGMDPDLRVTYANRHAMTTFGITKDDLDQGVNALSFIDPQEHQRARLSLEKLVRGEPEEEYEFTAVRKDGYRFPALIYTAVVSRGGEPAGFRGVVVDITARKKTEEEIRKSEAWYRNVLRTAMDGYCLIDMNGSFTDVNDAFCSLLGYSRTEVLALSLPLVEARETPEDTARHMEEIQRKGEDRFETVFRHRDGRIIDVEVSVVYAGPDDGRFITFSRDITERKRAEAELRQSEEKYRTIINITGEWIWDIDLSGRHTYSNPAIESILGYPCDEFLRLDPFSLIHPEDRERVKTLFTSSVQERTGWNNIVIRWRHKDGVYRYLESNAVPVFNDRGDLTGFRGADRDITERRIMENTVRRANQKLTLLNTLTRHDIANQLSILQGFTRVAALKKPDPVIADFLAKIADTARNIEGQIAFARDYQELGVRAPAWLSLEKVAVRTTGTVPVKFSGTCQGAEIFADPMLERVFFNLTENAVRHGERVTEITIRCERNRDGLKVIVEDNGIGIPDDQKEKIFGRGFGKHTGLGLFLAREILSITGIMIEETGRYGSGARFEMLVPAGGWRFSGTIPRG